MSKRIYVGNLPWSVTKAKLEELFSSFGQITEALVISDKYTGRSRGFGFVTFEDDESADRAIAEMNEKEVEGRRLIVKEATPLEPRERRDFDRGRSHSHERHERHERHGRHREENFDSE